MQNLRLSSFRQYILIAAVALLAFATTTAAYAATPDRITAAVDDSQRTTLAGNIHPMALRATSDLGEVDSSQKLQWVTVYFSMPAAQQAALTQLLQDQQNPASPLYQQWLTPEQFGAQFGMSTADLAAVSNWVASEGLNLVQTARGRNFIVVSGTAGQIEKAFGTQIHKLVAGGENHFANVSDLTIPSAFAGVVQSVTGLDDFKLKSRARSRTVKPDFTSSISGSHFIAPGDFYTIYDVNPLLSSSINGQGITIAVMGQTDISLSNVLAFRTASGLSTTNLPVVLLAGVTDPGVSENDIDEAQLDVEWSGAVAPNATILFVNSTNVISTSMVYAIDNNVAPIITVSYGNCEALFGSATTVNSFNTLFQQANSEGITIMGPAGDAGATDCDTGYPATQGLAVDFPASSPYVTGAGGTEFNEGSGSYWNSSNGNYQGSALSYIPEMVWNDSSSTNGLEAGGGGKSSYFTKPSWQTGTGVPADGARDVPDISLNASPNHDGYLFCSEYYSSTGADEGASCTNGGYRYTDGQSLDVVGGTSVSTPTFAGLLALVEQKVGHRLANANPAIYGLANSTYYANVFHDVTVGNNDSPCTVGSTGCTSSPIGFSATVGYDLASGWGSVDAYNMAQYWTTISGSVSSFINTTTTLSATPNSLASSATTTLTATVSSTSGTPTGTVQFYLCNTASACSPSSATSGSLSYPYLATATLSGGVASYTYSPSTLAAGTWQVYALYTGSSTYASSLGSTSFTITTSVAASFTLTPATTSLSVAPGGTATPVTFTVTGVNGFAGSITFSAASSLDGEYSFSATTVLLSSTATSATTQLTLYAYYADSQSGGLQQSVPGGNHAALRRYETGGGIALAGLLLFGVTGGRRRKRRLPVLLAVLMLAAMMGGVTGCGGSSASTGGGGTTLNSPAGVYPVTVTATGVASSGGTVTQTATVTLTVT
jgi:subtilase family serine protease